jgi:hypothetical protein
VSRSGEPSETRHRALVLPPKEATSTPTLTRQRATCSARARCVSRNIQPPSEPVGVRVAHGLPSSPPASRSRFPGLSPVMPVRAERIGAPRRRRGGIPRRQAPPDEERHPSTRRQLHALLSAAKLVTSPVPVSDTAPMATAPSTPQRQTGRSQHLPRGSVPFDETSGPIVTTWVYLAHAFRSQGFSPSQRFDPDLASWLYFAPLPSIGFFAFRAFPAWPAVAPLGARNSLAVSRHETTPSD